MSNLKFGLEKEYFLVDNNREPQVVPEGLPYDGCGWLVEARGEPSNNLLSAISNLRVEEQKIRDMIKRANIPHELCDDPIMKVSRDVRVAARRRYAKGLIEYRNLYGYEYHNNTEEEATSGIHISFTNPTTISLETIEMKEIECDVLSYREDGKQIYSPSTARVAEKKKIERIVNQMFDWGGIFGRMDRAFEEEIRGSKRNPGFYEIKNDGRIEYRSLPSNVNLDKVFSILSEILQKLGYNS